MKQIICDNTSIAQQAFETYAKFFEIPVVIIIILTWQNTYYNIQFDIILIDTSLNNILYVFYTRLIHNWS